MHGSGLTTPPERFFSRQWPDWLRRWIGDEQMTVFDVVERAQLSGRPVTDPDVAHLRGLTSLHFVALGRTHVTDAGLRYFRELTGLQGAGFDGTQITDEGLLHLSGLTNLQFLTLDDTRITDAGLAQYRLEPEKSSGRHLRLGKIPRFAA